MFPAAVCATLAGVYGLQQWRKRVGKSEEAPRSEGNTAGRSVRTLTAEDAIELVQFRYAWELQAYLRMAGVNFAERNVPHPSTSAAGELPFLRHGQSRRRRGALGGSL